jgi:photosystem II stability/assembly factor-like uncharacterized protein
MHRSLAASWTLALFALVLTAVCVFAGSAIAEPQDTNWVAMDLGAGGPWTSAAFIDGEHGWAVGSGIIARTTDGGADWTPQLTLPAGATVTGIDFGTPQSGWAVGYAPGGADWGPYVLHSGDGGETWTDYDEAGIAAAGALAGVEFVDAEHGWVWGYGGLWATADGGVTWTARQSAPAALHDVQFIDADTGFVVAGWSLYGPASAYRTSDAGRTWTRLGALQYSDGHYRELAFVDATHGFAISWVGQLGTTADGGATWTMTALPDGSADDLTAVDTQHIWVAADEGVWASSDAGASWRRQRPPVYPSEPRQTLLVRGDSAWLFAGTRAARTMINGLSDSWPPVTTVAGPRFIERTTSFPLSAIDQGSGVAQTWVRLDGGAWAQSESVTVDAPADLMTDTKHVIEASSTDVYGNWETPAPCTVVVDREAPRTLFIPPKPEKLGVWRNRAAHVAVMGHDGEGIGSSAVFVRVDGGLMRQHKDGWVCVTEAPKTHANDGAHTIRAYAVDGFGHVGPEGHCTVRIDTRRPVLKTRETARALADRGSIVFSAADPKPCAGTYRMKFRIVSGSGKVLMRKGYGRTYTVGHAYSYPFDCPWRQGIYKVILTVQDEAGNIDTGTLKLYVDYVTLP